MVDGEALNTAPVLSGVLQGSELGPILFLAFLKDMPVCWKAQCRLFADDNIIYRTVNSEEDAIKLQLDLDALHQWESDWGMTFNPPKCNAIHVSWKRVPLDHVCTLKGTRFEAVESATSLGVDVASDLTRNKQVHKAATKGNRALGFIKRDIRTKSGVTKELAYKALVRPTTRICFNRPEPSSEKLKKEIEKVQRCAVRYVSNHYAPMDSPTKMLQSLIWETLKRRLGLVGIPPDQLAPSTSSNRGHDMRYNIIYGRTDYYRIFFSPSLIPLWNQLSSKVIFSTSLEVFKSKLADLHIKPPE